MAQIRRVGFVGTGIMGAPMARRLIGAGYSLVVTDTREDARRQLEVLGARTVATAAEVADAAETVFASLPSPAAVEAVATGKLAIAQFRHVTARATASCRSSRTTRCQNARPCTRSKRASWRSSKA